MLIETGGKIKGGVTATAIAKLSADLRRKPRVGAADLVHPKGYPDICPGRRLPSLQEQQVGRRGPVAAIAQRPS